MTVVLKLFSSLMEYLPPDTDGNSVEINAALPVSCHDLVDRYKIPRENVQVIMVNGDFVPADLRDEPLKDGDKVSVWPSIQGG